MNKHQNCLLILALIALASCAKESSQNQSPAATNNKELPQTKAELVIINNTESKIEKVSATKYLVYAEKIYLTNLVNNSADNFVSINDCNELDLAQKEIDDLGSKILNLYLELQELKKDNTEKNKDLAFEKISTISGIKSELSKRKLVLNSRMNEIGLRTGAIFNTRLIKNVSALKSDNAGVEFTPVTEINFKLSLVADSIIYTSEIYRNSDINNRQNKLIDFMEIDKLTSDGDSVVKLNLDKDVTCRLMKNEKAEILIEQIK